MSSDEINFQAQPDDKEKQVSFEIGYVVPFWSSKPVYKYYLDLWVEGVILESIDISKKEYYLIGRNKNICDIYSNNMTISRVHCIIQHKDDGDIFLYDPDSVYGTFVNKNLIAKKQYVKLNVGDTFKMGKSSRMFILNGPEILYKSTDENHLNLINDNIEVSAISTAPLNLIDKSEIMEKRIKMITELHEKRENYKKNILQFHTDTNWGQKDFDEEIISHQKEEEDIYEQKEDKLNNNYEGNLNLLNLEELKERKDITEKQMTMINKLETIMNGIKKAKDEIIKLRKKEDHQGDLTEGQKKRIEMNEKKLNELNEKYETQETNLRISLSSKDEVAYLEQKFDRKLAKELNSDDEYYDRTLNVATKNEKNENKKLTDHIITENYETLKLKLESLIRNRQKLFDKLQQVEVKNSEKDEITKDIDSLDLFFEETKDKLSSDQKLILTNQINEISKDISKTQKLISLVTPSHIKIKHISKDEKLKLSVPISKTITSQDASNFSNKNKKKNFESVYDTVNRLNELSKKQTEAHLRKLADSDEEIIEEIDNFKEQIGKDLSTDENFKRKIEEFKKSLNKSKNEKEIIEDKGGLIINLNNNTDNILPQGRNIRKENIFSEIVDNINNNQFDITNYTKIQNVFKKKKEEKIIKRKPDIDIDFSSSGLQTFNVDEELLNKKRERKVYGVTTKPRNRNEEEIIGTEQYQDYDAIYSINEKGTEHNLNINHYQINHED